VATPAGAHHAQTTGFSSLPAGHNVNNMRYQTHLNLLKHAILRFIVDNMSGMRRLNGHPRPRGAYLRDAGGPPSAAGVTAANGCFQA